MSVKCPLFIAPKRAAYSFMEISLSFACSGKAFLSVYCRNNRY